MSNQRSFQGRCTVWTALCLMLALVLSQSLGLWHGIVHGPVSLAHAAHAEHAPHTTHTTPTSHSPHAAASEPWLGTHSGQAGSPECRLYDQCSHGDALVQVPALVLPPVLTVAVVSVLKGLAQARWHAHFQARGPPLVR